MASNIRFKEQGSPDFGRIKDFYLSQLARIETDSYDEAFGWSAYLVEAMIAAVAGAGEAAASQLVGFAEALERDIASMRGSMLALHEAVGEKVQASIVGAYSARLATSRNPQGYRAGASDHSRRRYANGVLLAALESPELVRATYDGIAFPNISLLDARAAQWHRLNFGAGSGHGSVNRIFSQSFGGLVLTGLGFSDESPSRPFTLPTGYWTAPRPGGAFYPVGEAGDLGKGHGFKLQKGPVATKGIAAWNFLDAGVETLVDLLPEAYSKRIDELVTQADRGRGAGSRTETKIIRPPAGGFGSRKRSRAVR